MSSPQEAYSRGHKGLPYSPMNSTQGIGSPSTIGILQGGFRSPLQLLLGHTPTTQLGAPKFVPKLHNSKTSQHLQPSRVHDAPKRQQALGNTMHPRVTSFSTFNFTYHRGESNPMQQLQKGKGTQSAQILHSHIPTKATNAMEGIREEEQRG